MEILTQQFLGNSIIFMLIGYVIVLAFQLYMMFLNWKQSKVNDQMSELVKEVKIIKKLIQKNNK